MVRRSPPQAGMATDLTVALVGMRPTLALARRIRIQVVRAGYLTPFRCPQRRFDDDGLHLASCGTTVHAVQSPRPESTANRGFRPIPTAVPTTACDRRDLAGRNGMESWTAGHGSARPDTARNVRLDHPDLRGHQPDPAGRDRKTLAAVGFSGFGRLPIRCRAAVMATIRERRPGVWEVRGFTGRDERGRPTQVSRTVHGGKRDALRWRRR